MLILTYIHGSLLEVSSDLVPFCRCVGFVTGWTFSLRCMFRHDKLHLCTSNLKGNPCRGNIHPSLLRYSIFTYRQCRGFSCNMFSLCLRVHITTPPVTAVCSGTLLITIDSYASSHFCGPDNAMVRMMWYCCHSGFGGYNQGL